MFYDDECGRGTRVRSHWMGKMLYKRVGGLVPPHWPGGYTDSLNDMVRSRVGVNTIWTNSKMVPRIYLPNTEKETINLMEIRNLFILVRQPIASQRVLEFTLWVASHCIEKIPVF